MMVGRALRAALSAGWTVRLQDPIAPDDESEPEPVLVSEYGLKPRSSELEDVEHAWRALQRSSS